MSEKVIIFDGEKTMEVGAKFFFQDERITSLKKDEIAQLYKNTAAYVYGIKRSVLTMNLFDSVYVAQRGLAILKQMVLDMYGDAIGMVIITEVDTQLKLAAK